MTASGANRPARDEDYWSFSATAGTAVWAYTDTGGQPNPGANSLHAHLDLRRPNGTGLIEHDNRDGTGNGGDSTIESGSSAAIAGATLAVTGTHFLFQREYGNNEVLDPYRLFLALSTTSRAEAEPNDTSAQANAITACPDVRSGSISPTDADLYAVAVPAGETLFVAADGNPERDGDSTDVVVSLLAPDGTTVLLRANSSTTGEDPPPAEAFSFNITVGGIHLVRVALNSTLGGGSTYRLMVADSELATPPPGPPPGEDDVAPGPPGPAPGATCAVRQADQVGTAGADVMVGTGADETFVGLGGNDQITGGGGNDTICAGPGKDTARGKSGNDRILGEGDGDTVKGGGGKDTLRGGSGKDRLNGGPGTDLCAQGAGTGPEVSCER